jgi:hypothetical protein
VTFERGAEVADLAAQCEVLLVNKANGYILEAF